MATLVSQANAAEASGLAFYTNLASAAGTGNALVARPTEVAMVEDGSWVVQGLHWSAWGSKMAHGSGISSSSNCTPNCATGKRTNLPAKVTLSSPGTVLGHRVYQCFQLTVAARPKSDERVCLKRTGSDYVYMSTAASSTGGGSSTKDPPEFFGPGEVSCSMTPTEVYCEQDLASTATLSPKGKVSICHGTITATIPKCEVGNPGEKTPTLKVGQTDTIGPFRCTAQTSSVTCEVIKTGKGFRIGTAGILTVVT
jgi:hypothetical protein